MLSFASGPAEATHDLERLITKFGMIVIETEGLLLHPRLVGKGEFGKGLVLTSTAPGTVSVAELLIEYFGTQVAGVAVNQTYRYSVENGTWVRAPAPDDCPGNDAARHEHLLAMASYLPSMIAADEFRGTGVLERTHSTLT